MEKKRYEMPGKMFSHIQVLDCHCKVVSFIPLPGEELNFLFRQLSQL